MDSKKFTISMAVRHFDYEYPFKVESLSGDVIKIVGECTQDCGCGEDGCDDGDHSGEDGYEDSNGDFWSEDDYCYLIAELPAWF